MKSQKIPNEIKVDRNRIARLLVLKMKEAEVKVSEAYKILDNAKSDKQIEKAYELFKDTEAMIPTYSVNKDNQILFDNMHKEIRAKLKEIEKLLGKKNKKLK